jgi:hypothetical protein
MQWQAVATPGQRNAEISWLQLPHFNQFTWCCHLLHLANDDDFHRIGRELAGNIRQNRRYKLLCTGGFVCHLGGSLDRIN